MRSDLDDLSKALIRLEREDPILERYLVENRPLPVSKRASSLDPEVLAA
jgi:hypothetical protein